MAGVTQGQCHAFGTPPLRYGVELWGLLLELIRPPPVPGVLELLGLGCGIRG